MLHFKPFEARNNILPVRPGAAAIVLCVLVSTACFRHPSEDVLTIENRTGVAINVFYNEEQRGLLDPNREGVFLADEVFTLGVSEWAWPGRLRATTLDGTVVFDRTYTRDEASDLDYRIVITSD